jgi:serine/threonine protein kinase
MAGRVAIASSSATITTGQFAYKFEYTNYGVTAQFLAARNAFLKRDPKAAKTLHLTPTPSESAVTIGPYTMGSMIASGAMGTVYAATCTKNDSFAIKVIRRQRANGGAVSSEIATLQKLKRELHNLPGYNKLLHLHEIIPAAAGDKYLPAVHLPMSNVYLLLQPLVPATLQTVLRRGDEPHLRKMQLLYDCLLGLYFLDRHYWIHRDIKPDNIGVSSQGAVLLDLGPSVSVPVPPQGYDPTPGRGGTVGYLAPEIEMHRHGVGAVVDIWALGVCAYMLFGKQQQHPWLHKVNP